MNTQNTPIHLHLWHKDFWLVAIASLLLPMSVYMFVPVFPLWLPLQGCFGSLQVGWVLGILGIGVFLLGTFCSYLVQHYRRNNVCMESILVMMMLVALLHYLHRMAGWFDGNCKQWMLVFLLLQRLLMGATFGLAQMVLGSTLVIDTCESSHRTEANHSSAWFARFALAMGPLAGLIVYRFFGFDGVVFGSLACSAVAVILIRSVHFPFRAPEEGVRLFSLDRFFMPQGLPLFGNLALVMTAVGMLLPFGTEPIFFVSVLGGFLLSLLAQHFVFRHAELKSEAITALLFLAAAIFMMLTSPLPVVHVASPALIGTGVGIFCSRFLMFFIKLSRHCQRGTAQSSYFLASETGIALGLFLHFSCCQQDEGSVLVFSLILVTAAFLLYHFFTHRWFMLHKNR